MNLPFNLARLDALVGCHGWSTGCRRLVRLDGEGNAN